jgi:hypothetical protein
LPTTPRGAILAQDPHALADQHLRVPPAQRAEPQVALVVDVVDDQADLVDVPEDRHLRIAVGDRLREARAERVVARIGEGRCVLAPDAGRQPLVAAGAGGVDQALKELHRLLAHPASYSRAHRLCATRPRPPAA